MDKLLQHIRIKDKPLKNIMISGGGNIGLRLAESLENEYKWALFSREVFCIFLLVFFFFDLLTEVYKCYSGYVCMVSG